MVFLKTRKFYIKVQIYKISFKKSIWQSQLLIPVQSQQLAMLMVAAIFRWAPGLWFSAVFPTSTRCAVEDSLLRLKAWGTFHSENELMPQIVI